MGAPRHSQLVSEIIYISIGDYLWFKLYYCLEKFTRQIDDNFLIFLG